MSRLTKAIADTAARRLFRTATVSEVTHLGERFRAVELAFDDADGNSSFRVGDKLQVRTDIEGLAMRTYTPITWNAAQGTTRLLAYVHGAGPGSRWIEAASVGTDCQFFGPRRSLSLDDLTEPMVIVGDETSFALAAAWRNAHPDRPPSDHLFEVTDPDDCTAALDSIGLASARLFQRDTESAHLDQLIAHLVETLRSHPDAPVCLTGRARTIASVRRSLKDAGLTGHPVRVKAYWDENRSGLD